MAIDAESQLKSYINKKKEKSWAPCGSIVESLSMYLVVAKPFFHHHERVKRESPDGES